MRVTGTYDPVEAEAELAAVERPEADQRESDRTPDDGGLDLMTEYVERETAHVDPFPAGEHAR